MNVEVAAEYRDRVDVGARFSFKNESVMESSQSSPRF